MGINNFPISIALRIQKALGYASESSLALQKERLNICRKCSDINVEEFLDKKLETCSLCKCILELKTLVPSESCKIKKW